MTTNIPRLETLSDADLMLAAIEAGHVFAATNLPSETDYLNAWNLLVWTFGDPKRQLVDVPQ